MMITVGGTTKMPWSVKRNSGKFCVTKKGDTSPVPGGCHKTRKEALAHQRALYASEADKK